MILILRIYLPLAMWVNFLFKLNKLVQFPILCHNYLSSVIRCIFGAVLWAAVSKNNLHILRKEFSILVFLACLHFV